MTLIEFLRARLDEDEAAARAAAAHDGPQWVARSGMLYDESNPSTHPGPFATGVWGDLDDEVAEHIARHDPARVLAEVDAKRRIAELHAAHDFPYNPDDGPGDYAWTPRCDHCHHEWPCTTLQLLALPYVDHPDYDESWKP